MQPQQLQGLQQLMLAQEALCQGETDRVKYPILCMTLFCPRAVGRILQDSLLELLTWTLVPALTTAVYGADTEKSKYIREFSFECLKE